MPRRSTAPVEAISLEISRSPKMALLADPTEVPAVSAGPMVVLIDLKLPDLSGTSFAPPRAGHRLMEAVLVLMRGDERPQWLIEADEPESFARAYRTILDHAVHAEQISPVVFYLPHHGSRKHVELSHEDLLRTRSMLELLGYGVSDQV